MCDKVSFDGTSLLSLWGLQENDEKLHQIVCSSGVWLGESIPVCCNEDHRAAPPIQKDETNKTESDHEIFTSKPGTHHTTSSHNINEMVYCQYCGMQNSVVNNWCESCGKCLNVNFETSSEVRVKKNHPIKSKCLLDLSSSSMNDIGKIPPENQRSKQIHSKVSQYDCVTSQVTQETLKDRSMKLKTTRRIPLMKESKEIKTNCNHTSISTKSHVSDSTKNCDDTSTSISTKSHVSDSNLTYTYSELNSTTVCRCSNKCVNDGTSTCTCIHKRRWPSSGFYMWKKPSTLRNTSSLSESSETSHEVHAHYKSQLKSLKNLSLSLSLLDLPDEILLIIMSYLTSPELNLFKRVCRRLYCLSYDPSLPGHQIILSGTICGTELLEAATTHPSTLVMRRCHFDILLKDIESSIFLLGSYLKCLTVDTCNLGPYTSGSDALLHSLSLNCPNLTSLKLEWIMISGSSLMEVMKKCLNIEELSLLEVSGVLVREWTRIVRTLAKLQSCKLQILKLKLRPEIHLSAILPGKYKQSIPSLKSLMIRQNMSTIFQEEMTVLLSAAPELNLLEIECMELSQDVIQTLQNRSVTLQLHES